jgi:ABC-type transport system involved in cytochrome c biogenesis permease subunit
MNALHQLPSVLRPGLDPTLDPSMLASLIAMTIAFTFLYAYLMSARVGIERRRQARILEARA